MKTVFIVQDPFRGLMQIKKPTSVVDIPMVALVPREADDQRLLARHGLQHGDMVELTFDSGGLVTSIRRPSSLQDIWRRPGIY